MRFVLRKASERQRQERDRRIDRGWSPKAAFALQPANIGINEGRAVDLPEKTEIDQHDKPRG